MHRELPILTLIQFLEDLADTKRSITIPANEVERLVERFGNRVRRMGRWNASGDGSLEIPVCVIREAATQLGAHSLTEAVRELKTEQFTKMLEASSAASLIEKVTEAYHRHFRDLMNRYQSSNDPGETTRIRDQLVREIFGE
jgi:hypothetical protein